MVIKYHNYKFDEESSNKIKYIPSVNRKNKFGPWYLMTGVAICLVCYPRFAQSVYNFFYPLEEQVEKRVAKKQAYETLILSKNQFKNNFIRSSSSI